MTTYAKTLHEAFRTYLRTVTPKAWERAKVSEHRERLHGALANEFVLLDFFESGSFKNGTGISIYSDVDYIARFPYDMKPGSSDIALNRLRDALRDGLWQVQDVSVDRPAVSVTFDYASARSDIVPAYLHKSAADDTNAVLHIPGPGGTWLEAAPRAHLAYVDRQNAKHDGEVKGLARLLKAWKYEKTVLVSSFYLEMRAAQYGENNDYVSYITALRDVLKDLVSHEMRDMNDPTHLVSRITACSSESERSSALRDARAASDKMAAAVEAWLEGEPFDMSDHLQAVFGDEFPTVYGDEG